MQCVAAQKTALRPAWLPPTQPRSAGMLPAVVPARSQPFGNPEGPLPFGPDATIRQLHLVTVLATEWMKGEC